MYKDSPNNKLKKYLMQGKAGMPSTHSRCLNQMLFSSPSPGPEASSNRFLDAQPLNAHRTCYLYLSVSSFVTFHTVVFANGQIVLF